MNKDKKNIVITKPTGEIIRKNSTLKTQPPKGKQMGGES